MLANFVLFSKAHLKLYFFLEAQKDYSTFFWYSSLFLNLIALTNYQTLGSFLGVTGNCTFSSGCLLTV